MQKEGLMQLFQKLGLTEYESKAITTLINNKELKAPDISRIAEVPKTRVYDVLEKLVSKGLVMELHGRPKRYRTEEAEKILDTLILGKKGEFSALVENAEKAKKMLRTPEKSEEQGTRILRAKNRGDLAKIIAFELQNAENSVVGFAEVLPKDSTLKKAIRSLKEKNVEVKLLHPKTNEISEIAKNGIGIKNAEHGMEAYIIDDKKLILSLNDLKKENEEYSFVIWHDSPVIQPLKRHFEEYWNKKN